MEHKGQENLVQYRTDITEEQRRAARSKGGKARAQKARERRSFKESAEMMLAGAIPLWSYEELQKYELPGVRKSSTMQDAILAQMILIANGKVEGVRSSDQIRAAEFLRDTVGDKNPEKVDVTGGSVRFTFESGGGDDLSG